MLQQMYLRRSATQNAIEANLYQFDFLEETRHIREVSLGAE
jgi:hypothetical protein